VVPLARPSLEYVFARSCCLPVLSPVVPPRLPLHAFRAQIWTVDHHLSGCNLSSTFTKLPLTESGLYLLMYPHFLGLD
jgi:hypothetical protein